MPTEASASMRWVSLFAIVGVLLSGAVAASANADPVGEGRYIVVLEDSVKHPGAVAADQAEEVDAEVSFVYRAAVEGYAATLPRDEVETLESDPRVKYVTPDRRVELAEQETPTGIDRIFATENASLEIDGAENITVDADVAVIDTGIDFEHPDLDVVARTNCVPVGENTTTKACVDNSGVDGHSHGTHVAGTIAAIDDENGVVGVAPGVRLWAVRVLNNGGSGYESWVLAGVEWVTAHADEIEVANMSLGCICSQPALAEGIKSSIAAGVVYAVAAGNNSIDAASFSPANQAEVITVSALADYDGAPGGLAEPTCEEYGVDDTLAYFSNWGTTIEVAAPGVCIRSTLPSGGYGFKSGTSMASPHVAGAAAILAAESNPNSKEDVVAIREAITEAGNFNWIDFYADEVQEPLLDVGDEGVFAVVPRPLVTTQAADSLGTESATLRALVNPRGLATEYEFEYGTTTSYGQSAPIPAGELEPGYEPIEVEGPIEALEPNTTYHFRVVATNEAGTSYGEDVEFRTLRGSIPKFAFTTGSAGSGDGQVERPFEIAVDSKGNVWVADTQNHRIEQFNAAGEYLRKSGSFGSAAGKFSSPLGIAVDAKDNVWVADTYNHRIQKFNDKGEYLMQVGSFGSGDGQFKRPGGIAIDPKGNIWVADTFNHRIQKFNDKGEFLTKVGKTGFYGTGNGEFIEPSGIAAGAKGNIWVADSGNSRIQRFDENGAFVAKFGSFGSANGQFFALSALEVDSEGEIWAVDAGNGRVQRFAENGEYVGRLGSFGSHDGQFTQVRGIAAGDDGSLWTVDLDDFIQKWSFVASASAPKSTTGVATSVSSYAAQLNGECNAGGFDTNCYFEYGTSESYGAKTPVSESGVGSAVGDVPVSTLIEGLTDNTTYHFRLVAAGPGGTVAGSDQTFKTPLATPVVSTQPAEHVQRRKATLVATVNPNGLEAEYFFEYGVTTAYGQVAPEPGKSAGSAVGDLEVSEEVKGLEPDTLYHYRIVAVNAKGTAYGEDLQFTTDPVGTPVFSLSIGENGSGNGQFESPAAIALDEEGDLWVADTGNGRVQELTPEGEFLTKFGSWGTGSNQFMEPRGIAVGPEDNIWVVDTGNSRVQEFDSEGKFIRKFGSEGSAAGKFASPTGVDVDEEGNVWVVDTQNNRVQRFNEKGEYLSQFGSAGTEPGELSIPTGIAVDSEGDLWIADSGNSRVQRFSPEGEFLAEFGSYGYGDGQFLGYQTGIAIDSEGNIWVADESFGRLQQFSPEGVFLQKFGEFGFEEGQLGGMQVGSNVAIGPEEEMWILDGNSRIQKWVPSE